MNLLIKKHIDTYYNLLLTHTPVNVSKLIPSYLEMKPLLHNDSVNNYILTRLPKEIQKTEKIIIAHDTADLEKVGYKMDYWEKSVAKDRRRRNYYQDNIKTLACIITSFSDVDDLVNSLIAFQVERQKTDPEARDFTIELLNGSEENFRKIAQKWWEEVNSRSLIFGLTNAPVYFVFSNLHSLSNIIGGYVREKQNEIFNYSEKKYPAILQQWSEVKEKNALRVNDFLYYISSLYLNDNPDAVADKEKFETHLNFHKVKVESELFCDALIIPVSSLAHSNYVDPYISIIDKEKLNQSKAFIVNVDYPLGLSAYYLLSEILKTGLNICGIYVQGKAAILNGQIGDVQIPSEIYDERDDKSYTINNIFNQQSPTNAFQSNIHTNQKSITAYGTFLETQEQLEAYKKENFNIIEMESGPYIKAIKESNYNGEIGIINYASDNPLSQTLGDSQMGIKGVEPTYLGSLSIVQRIVDLESFH